MNIVFHAIVIGEHQVTTAVIAALTLLEPRNLSGARGTHTEAKVPVDALEARRRRIERTEQLACFCGKRPLGRVPNEDVAAVGLGEIDGIHNGVHLKFLTVFFKVIVAL